MIVFLTTVLVVICKETNYHVQSDDRAIEFAMRPMLIGSESEVLASYTGFISRGCRSAVNTSEFPVNPAH